MQCIIPLTNPARISTADHCSPHRYETSCVSYIVVLQVIYGYQKLATCSMDNNDLPANSNALGVMITLRMRLSCSIVRAGAQEPDQEYEVLNEIVVDRGSNSFLTNIEAYINGNFITRVQVRLHDGYGLAYHTLVKRLETC
eukprot:GHUV01046757.1.p1 GENE.GHUV01046757.1~~GHUV01046757.1.p1  ORF type:complete len:141 (-),score=26.55 GHUV01046757.1:17-439(-)